MNLDAELQVEIPPDEPLIRFRRTVAATPEAVFAAWTEPAQLRRWWGPAEWTLVVCEVDLRVGPGRLLVNTFVFDGTPDRESIDESSDPRRNRHGNHRHRRPVHLRRRIRQGRAIAGLLRLLRA